MYKLSRLAVEDFASIYEYTLLNFGARQADAYLDELDSVLQLLADMPLMGHDYHHVSDNLRRHDHQQHAIFYRQRQQDIFIVRILHQQMDLFRYLFD